MRGPRAGDIDTAQKLLGDAVSTLEVAGLAAPEDLRLAIREDLLDIAGTTDMLIQTGGADLSSKMTRSSCYRRTTKRGAGSRQHPVSE